MSRVSIKRIKLTDFKGQHEKEILLNGSNAIVAGKNGSGKTTLADSWYWTMDDKDYLLKNNPDIRPDYERDCVPRVDIELEIDGKPLNIAKYHKKSVSKPKRMERFGLHCPTNMKSMVWQKPRNPFERIWQSKGLILTISLYYPTLMLLRIRN